MKWRRSKNQVTLEGEFEIDQFLDAIDEGKALVLALNAATREQRRSASEFNRAAARLNMASERAERAEKALKRAQRG